MKKKCMRVFALALAISVLFVQVDTVSANAVANAPVVVQERPQIQNVGFVAEWVAGLGISAGRLVAFAFVLTLLGFVVENGISNAWENREEYLSYLTNLKEDFTNWCADSKEWCSLKVNDFDMWLDMVAQGTLDKSSDCWQAIKDYCVDLKSRIDDLNKPTPATDVIKVDGAENWFNTMKTMRSNNDLPVERQYMNGTSISTAQTMLTTKLPMWSSYTLSYTENTYLVSFKFSDASNVLLGINPYWTPDMIDNFNANCTYANFDGISSRKYIQYTVDTIKGIPNFCANWIYGYTTSEVLTGENCVTYELDFPAPKTNDEEALLVPILGALGAGLLTGYNEWDIAMPKDDGISEDVAQGLTVAGGTSGVIERDGSLDNVDVVGVGGAVTDDVVPIDWDNVSVEDLVEPYPFDDVKTVDLVDGVIVGTDTPIDQITNPDGSTDTDTDRDNYTLSGLTELFPFCIPFDLVMLFRTLKADAKAPSFTWKFVYYVDGKKKTEDIEIDLSRFDSVAQLLRTMELLAFMVALTLKTRDLIRG